MMTISLSDAGKRYNREWIFRHFNYSFQTGKRYAITGPNGSGKSTLLQSVGGAIALSEGGLGYRWEAGGGSHETGDGGRGAGATSYWQPAAGNRKPETDLLYQYIAIAAPYLELIEEMTVTEFLHFHSRFKPLLAGWGIPSIIERVGLAPAAHKQIRYYSSGMKQRVKLAQAIFTDVPVLLLDEPCTNLDSDGVRLYQQLVTGYCSNRMVLVSSNDETEYGFCEARICILDWKSH